VRRFYYETSTRAFKSGPFGWAQRLRRLKSITGAFRLLRKPVLILRHQVLKRGAILGAAFF